MKKKIESNFESRLNRLEEILAILDDDSTSLEDMMLVYEEGITLAKELKEYLDKAETKISELKVKSE
jgi:exodeoxyribonuclease VII small subunit